MIPPEYLALRAKVDAFAADVAARRGDAMRCRAGCDGCCHVRLSLSDVEADALREGLAALDDATLDALEEELGRRRGRRCLLLGPDGRCRAYDARPLVCRSQGLPLRYPAGTVPVETVRARAGGGEVTWCPLNFDVEGDGEGDGDPAPGPDDVLDAERVDLILAVINRGHASDPLRRTGLDDVVAGFLTHRR